jgi:PAS domain S-box-containing protein
MLSYRDLYSSLLDSIPLGICVLQSTYKVVFWNRCLEDWTGVGRDRIEGQSIGDFFPHLSQSRYTSRIDPIFTGGPPAIFSSQLHQHLIPAPIANGRNRIQHTTVTAIPALEGSGFYAMLSLQDVTDMTFRVQEYRLMRDRAIAKAEDRELMMRQLDNFVSHVTHDLKAPLRGISNVAEWIKTDLSETIDPATQKNLELMQLQVVRMQNLIDGLLDYAKSSDLSIGTETFKVEQLITEIVDSLTIPSSFILDLPTELPPITTNRILLSQVLTNLIGNAYKHHNRSAGKIRVTAEPQGKDWKFSVVDDGCGIAPENHERVFVIFHTLSDSSKENTGIGLSIVKKIIEERGGEIALESQLGAGATFHFTWVVD